MRLYSFVAAAALATASLAAHANTISQIFSVSNGVASKGSTGYVVDTSFFGQLDPSLGTLTSIDISLIGSAVDTSSNPFPDNFIGVDPANAVGADLGLTRHGSGFGTFNFSANGQDSYGPDLAYFEGTGLQALALIFVGSTTVISASGSITYDYTPAVTPVAATPEPSSLALLGTGLLGALGVAPKRFA